MPPRIPSLFQNFSSVHLFRNGVKHSSYHSVRVPELILNSDERCAFDVCAIDRVQEGRTFIRPCDLQRNAPAKETRKAWYYGLCVVIRASGLRFVQ